MQIRTALLIGVCIALPSSSFADFRYDETTKVNGGSIVSMTKFMGAFSKNARQITDPVTSTILVKGNRMAHINQETSEIIDLDNETITHIDHTKKQYTVETFQEMKAAMEEAMRQAQQQQPQAKQEQPTTPTQMPEMHFKVNVNNTGAKKDVAGLSASQSILKMLMEAKDQKTGQTGNMAMTNDMWMVPEIPGYDQVHDFNERMAAKMASSFSGVGMPSMSSLMSPQLLQAQPGMFSGMSEMAKEMDKIKGVPVSQIIRIGSTTDGSQLPAASEAPLPTQNGPNGGSMSQAAANGAANAAGSAAADSAQNKIASKLGLGGLGGFGFGRKKQQQPPAQTNTQPQQTWSVLMETSVETTGFSSASVDPALFNVPAGYSKVPTEYQKMHQ